jgi:hypothetical protein
MDIKSLTQAINFITTSKYKSIKENEIKSEQAFHKLKSNLRKAITGKCNKPYTFLTKNNLLVEEENPESLFGFHFNNITKQNIQIADQFEECVLGLSSGITSFLERMNSMQDAIDNSFMDCKTTCVDDKINLTIDNKDSIIITCLNDCYHNVIKSHNDFTEEYVKEINNFNKMF